MRLFFGSDANVAALSQLLSLNKKVVILEMLFKTFDNKFKFYKFLTSCATAQAQREIR